MARQLVEKQEAFCYEYVSNGYNPQKAYLAVYNTKNPKQASDKAYQLLKRPEVKAKIAEIQKERFEQLSINADRVAEELAKVAFAEKGDEYYNATAKLKALELLQKQLGLQTTKVEAKVNDININII